MTVTRTAVPMATVLSIRDKWSGDVMIRRKESYMKATRK